MATLPGCEGHTYKHSVLHTHTAVVTHIYIYVVEMVPNQVMGEMVLEGGGHFIPAGISGLHT